MQLRKKEIEIEWDGKPAKIVVRELTWGELNDAIRKSTKMQNIGGVVKTEMDSVTFREELIVKSIEEAPFKIDKKTIRSLPARIVEKIWKVVSELNPLA